VTSRAEPAATDDAALRAMAEVLGLALVARRQRIAVAESCTGGWIAKVLTDVPGSSDWFEAGLVTYSNAAKQSMLGVSAALLETEGAVSEAVVRAMAAGVRAAARADAAIAVSGIAGPGGGSPTKPVGLVHLAFALGERDWAIRVRLSGDREAVRRQTVARALAEMISALTS